MVHLFNHTFSLYQPLLLLLLVNICWFSLQETILSVFTAFLAFSNFRLFFRTIPFGLKVPSFRVKTLSTGYLEFMCGFLPENMLRKWNIFKRKPLSTDNSIQRTLEFTAKVGLWLIWRLDGYFSFEWLLAVHFKIMFNFFRIMIIRNLFPVDIKPVKLNDSSSIPHQHFNIFAHIISLGC